MESYETRIRGLIRDEVSMGTYGLVELEVRELESKLKEAEDRISLMCTGCCSPDVRKGCGCIGAKEDK